MADQLQLRGGKTAQSQSFVGAEREITIDTELFAVRLHDGTTPGGHIIASLDTVQGLLAEQSNSFSTDLSSETTDREAAIAALQAAVNQAIADRTAADAATLSSANSYTDTKVDDVLGNAPELLNQLEELAAALGDDENFAVTITNSIAALQADVDQNEADSDAADTALSDRITVLETDPTTASALASLQADVDQNETDADAADAALSARIAVLETDPTTAAALAAVQADVDANETARIAADATTLSSANSYTDSQVAAGDATVTNTLNASITSEATTRAAADTALSARLDVLEVDPTTQAAVTSAVAAEETRALAAEAAISATHAADEADHEALELNAGLCFGQLYVGDLIVA